MRCNVVGAGQQGPTNVILMIPFCRRRRSEQVLKRMAECGLKRGENGLQIYDVRDP
jgi:pyruvate,water dikinase